MNLYDPWEHDETCERDSLYNSLLHPLNGFPCLSLRRKFYKRKHGSQHLKPEPYARVFSGAGWTSVGVSQAASLQVIQPDSFPGKGNV